MLATIKYPVLKQKKNEKEGTLFNTESLLFSGNFEDPHKHVLPALSNGGGLLNQPLSLEAVDLVLEHAQEEKGRATRIKHIKEENKYLKFSHFDRISEIALEYSKKVEYKQFRDFYCKYKRNKYLSKEKISEIKRRF